MNHDLNNLQRELIKEKHVLNNTMDQLNKANDDLKQLNATKDRFISILGHDLRNPFNSLLGFSELLLTNIDHYDNETIKELLRVRKLKNQYVEDPCKEAAKLLAENKIVAWFQGRMEFGPRALGNRSILMSPIHPENKNTINV